MQDYQRRRRYKKRKKKNNQSSYYGEYRNYNATKKSNVGNIIGVFVALIILVAIIVGGIYTYRNLKPQEETVILTELGEATLPQVAFLEEGYEVNTLLGYTTQMDILTTRDAIAPLTPQGKLQLVLKPYENEIAEVSYCIMAIDGEMVLKEDTITEWEEDAITLDLSNVLPDADESLLEIELTLADGTNVYYYTRLITYGNCNLSNNLEFVSMFHNAIMQGTTDISEYLTSSTSTSNATLQYVTQASSEDDVTWGNLSPTIVGDVSWTITECSSLYISVLLEYQVEVLSEETGNTEKYNVEEFFRVGYSSSEMAVQLKQYTRSMNQIFDVDQVVLSEDGIDLGITADTIEYKMNEEETVIAFVQERGLYTYNGSEIIELFTLEGVDSTDVRYRNNEYDINILSIDENGSISFVVYGYMNRGMNEGEVGTGVYYYNADTNVLEEIAFVAINSCFQLGKEVMSQGMYYSSEQNVLYLIAQNAFYKVDLTANEQEKLAENMEEDSYVISDDGKIIAYLLDDECVILEFETGISYNVNVDGNDQMMLLGYLEHDLIYGVYNTDDILADETGKEIMPLYEVNICSQEGEHLKTYVAEGQFIRDISILGNMITMNLVQEDNGIYVYNGQDVMTNNVVENTENVEIISYSTDIKQVQKLLSFTLTTEIEEEQQDELLVVYPQMALSEDAIYISYELDLSTSEMYYAYVGGKLELQSTMASDAIQYASVNIGAVVNENMEYVWRSGSRDLTFTVSKYSDYKTRMANGESAIEIVSESANQNIVFYTGCTIEQMCYIINQEQVIAAKLNDGSWILLVGYTGNTMYYLNENGVRESAYMSTLDTKIVELVGDGLF